jgi:hypothetical protein
MVKLSEILGTDGDYLDEVAITFDGVSLEVLTEGRKWVSGRFDKNIGIDQPTHLAGKSLAPGEKLPQPHAHVYGLKGEEIGVVNWDGSSSHGSKMKLHPADADALRSRGCKIPPSNVVEWTMLGVQTRILLG